MRSLASGTAMLALATVLMMFPQIVETIYSPALTSIAQGFAVDNAAAGQTLSLYFAAFAGGTLLLGYLADRIGRRPAMLTGLLLYVAGCALALWAPSFSWLLLARAVSAVGASAGSIVTQTWLRDRYSSSSLAQVYAVLGMALAVSPALGLLAGSMLVAHGGYVSVFTALAGGGCMLLIWVWVGMPESQDPTPATAAIASVLRRMRADRRVQLVAVLVALYNWLLFAFYQLAAFHLQQWGYGVTIFGYSSIALCAGAVAGAGLNRYLLGRGCLPQSLVDVSNPLLGLGCAAVAGLLLLQWPAFLAAMALVSMVYGLAIPNLLAQALHGYADCRGSAGALLGAGYYILLAALLVLSALAQNLTLVVLAAWAGIACTQMLLRHHPPHAPVQPLS